MNAIAPAMATMALAPALTLERIGQRLAEIDSVLTPLSANAPPGLDRRPQVLRLEEERDALHEVVLTMEPCTLADAAVVAMVVPYEIGIAIDPGPNRKWNCDPGVRGENIGDAIYRLAMLLCREAGVAPQSLGGNYYLSHLLGDGA